MTDIKPVQLPDQASRDAILCELDTTFLVEAAAGTGKTTSMTGRMVRLLAEGKCRIANLAAVTFTRKASSELRTRFIEDLKRSTQIEKDEDVAARLKTALDHAEQCFIGTIHSFCGRLLRERPVEAGVGFNFREMEEEEDRTLQDQAWERLVARLYAEGDSILEELSDLGIALPDLKEAYKTFVTYPDVEAWPAGNAAAPDISKAFEMMRTYAAHMEQVVANIEGDPGNDELIPLYRRLPRRLRRTHPEQAPEVMELLKQFRPAKLVQKQWPAKDMAKEEAARMERFHEEVTAPFLRQWMEFRYPVVLQLLQKGAVQYEEMKRGMDCLNFQDLLLGAARLLRDKPHIRRYFRKRFTHILVDEFQDTDPIQAEVMLLLSADNPRETDWRKCRPLPGSLFVVGDPKQSIYRFRRADIVTYNEVKRIIEASGGQVLNLSCNFRTLPPILDWVNGCFRARFRNPATEYSPRYVDLEPGRQNKSDLVPVAFLQAPDTGNGDIHAWEAGQIAGYIKACIDNEIPIPRSPKEKRLGKGDAACPGDFLIVTWKTKRLSIYADALRDLGIPHEVTGGTTLNRSREVALLAGCLTALTNPDDPVALVALLRGEVFGFSDRELLNYHLAGGRFQFETPIPETLDQADRTMFRETFDRLKRYFGWLHTYPPVAAIERIVDDLGLMALAAARPGGHEQAGSLAKALEILRSRQIVLWSLSDLLKVLRGLVDEEEKQDSISVRNQESDCVRVMNLHKVKGLEAPIVFLADPSGEHTYPSSLHIDRSGDRVFGYLRVARRVGEFQSENVAYPVGWAAKADVENEFSEHEKTRLLYVAATRAGVQLVVSMRDKRENQNPWGSFGEHLPADLQLPLPQPATRIDLSSLDLHASEWAAAAEQISRDWKQCAAATYSRSAAKQLSKHEHPKIAEARGLGTHWGSVIHALLEIRLMNAEAPLIDEAKSQLVEYHLDLDLAQEAVDIVQAVAGSEVWKRALQSSHYLAEVPFLILDEEGSDPLPHILRGQIDLVFEEDGEWVIVDYKTDPASEQKDLNALMEFYRPQMSNYERAWRNISGKRVKELGLYFVSTQRYLTL
jgi:ATP-dependent helicase/nuclease subunit A